MSIELKLLVAQLSLALLVIALVGSRMLVVRYPLIGAWLVSVLRPRQRRTRRLRRVNQFTLRRVSRMELHHRRCVIMSRPAQRLPGATGASDGVARAQQQPVVPVAITQTDRNALLLDGRMDALATFVAARLISETEGIKLLEGVNPSSSNKTYQAARAALKAAQARRQTFPALTEDQRAFRQAMRLPV